MLARIMAVARSVNIEERLLHSEHVARIRPHPHMWKDNREEVAQEQ